MRSPAFPCLPADSPLRRCLGSIAVSALVSSTTTLAADLGVDFNRDIRPILSQNCFVCHGPDENERKSGLRLDTQAGQRHDLGGYAAVVPGRPEASALYQRIATADKADLMPPPKTGKQLAPEQIARVRQWIAEGGRFTSHWSYERPVRPPLPEVRDPTWIRNPVDRFILARLEVEGLRPQPEADRFTLARRLALDLTGLPPTVDEADAFAADPAPDAYERYVDALLARETFGEHWARLWLDLARYADSAGYADDPPRTIWPYRDYVIRAFNKGLSFDLFTIEQFAGDLLPDATEEQLIATAFHRNTMTNSEGGTNDEEFRTVAVVDRVNTTFAVWMGTSMACAQCHTHKYDPISQHEYFQLYAFLNNTADADRPDEAPVLEIYPPTLKEKRDRLAKEFDALDRTFRSPSPDLVEAAQRWARVFPAKLDWQTPPPTAFHAKSGAEIRRLDDRSLRVAGTGENRFEDTYTIDLAFDRAATLTALRLEALADEGLERKGPGLGGNFAVRSVRASILPVPNQGGTPVRYIRVELPAKGVLQLGEVQVFSNGENVAPAGAASLSSTDGMAIASRAIDGVTEATADSAAVALSLEEERPWWELDLRSVRPVERIVIHSAAESPQRLEGFRVVALDEERREVWARDGNKAPRPSTAFDLTGPRDVVFATAAADVNQGGWNEALVVTSQPKSTAPRTRQKKGGEKGWSIGDATGQDHALVMVTAQPTEIPRGATLRVIVEQSSSREKQTLGRFRLSATDDARVAEHAETPVAVVKALAVEEAARETKERDAVLDYFVRHVAAGLETERDRLAELARQRDAIKPYTVPIYRELKGDKRRTTQVQIRGNYLVTGDTVTEAVPAVWHPFPSEAPRNRLGLARWLVSEENPLTARVVANRFWEQIFGTGIVRTSEEFGSQGELPIHPELLDWLAVELIARQWDVKSFLKLLVTSAAYRQSSRATPEALEKDPENRLLSRGPRFRLTAEMVRDQALAAAGLLSARMYGPPVRPPRPNLGLRAAFGGDLDWQPSKGDDRYRRAIYTEWRRTSPFPSMATFDAPNREVCMLRRNRSNTPLQALVTLNDPAFIEAAQALARRMVQAGSTPEARLRHGFRIVLTRPPAPAELAELTRLQAEARVAFAEDAEKAKTFATDPLGAPAADADIPELAAWTAVANVLLNLDETLMKR